MIHGKTTVVTWPMQFFEIVYTFPMQVIKLAMLIGTQYVLWQLQQ